MTRKVSRCFRWRDVLDSRKIVFDLPPPNRRRGGTGSEIGVEEYRETVVVIQ